MKVSRDVSALIVAFVRGESFGLLCPSRRSAVAVAAAASASIRDMSGVQVRFPVKCVGRSWTVTTGTANADG
jgi:formylmethanofuran:tetrahydromethanopterin formyltransferase